MSSEAAKMKGNANAALWQQAMTVGRYSLQEFIHLGQLFFYWLKLLILASINNAIIFINGSQF